MEVWMELSFKDISSIRLAVKLAMYSTPRASSRARSEPSPPMGTTVPMVAAQMVHGKQMAAVKYQNRYLEKFTLMLRLSAYLPPDFRNEGRGDRAGERAAMADYWIVPREPIIRVARLLPMTCAEVVVPHELKTCPA